MEHLDFDEPSGLAAREQRVMRELWMIGAAGALGAMSRYGVTLFAERYSQSSWPVGTLVANLLGCLLLGLVMEGLQLRDAVSRELGLALTVGFLGAFTTFSTFGHETVRLFERGAGGLALAYVALSVIAGCGLCFAGVKLARTLWAA